MVHQLTNHNLDNLVKIGQLKSEPSEEIEVLRMLEISHRRLLDSGIAEVSIEGRFTSAYNAAHGAHLLLCAGMDIEVKIDSWCSSVLGTP